MPIRPGHGHGMTDGRGWTWTLHYAPYPEAETWRLTHSDGRVAFAKIAQRGRYAGPPAEAARLRWAAAFLPVPAVIESDANEAVEWLVTAALPGEDGTTPALMARPAELVPALARGLRRFHDAAPVASCPFDFRLDVALPHVRERARIGIIDPAEDLHSEFAHHTVDSAIAELESTRPPSEDLVVCHGDYCLPNVLLEDGEVTGYIDLGELGVADRWWDVAIGAWSITWNLGPGYEELFYENYAIAPDAARIHFYRLLYDLVS